jgi:hypothetical protein
MRAWIAAVWIVAGMAVGLSGCQKQTEPPPAAAPSTGEQPKTEQPTNEAPKTEHPTGEHPSGEHPK